MLVWVRVIAGSIVTSIQGTIWRLPSQRILRAWCSIAAVKRRTAAVPAYIRIVDWQRVLLWNIRHGSWWEVEFVHFVSRASSMAVVVLLAYHISAHPVAAFDSRQAR